jgi:hypothetical protein
MWGKALPHLISGCVRNPARLDYRDPSHNRESFLHALPSSPPRLPSVLHPASEGESRTHLRGVQHDAHAAPLEA